MQILFAAAFLFATLANIFALAVFAILLHRQLKAWEDSLPRHPAYGNITPMSRRRGGEPA